MKSSELPELIELIKCLCWNVTGLISPPVHVQTIRLCLTVPLEMNDLFSFLNFQCLKYIISGEWEECQLFEISVTAQATE